MAGKEQEYQAVRAQLDHNLKVRIWVVVVFTALWSILALYSAKELGTTQDASLNPYIFSTILLIVLLTLGTITRQLSASIITIETYIQVFHETDSEQRYLTCSEQAKRNNIICDRTERTIGIWMLFLTAFSFLLPCLTIQNIRYFQGESMLTNKALLFYVPFALWTVSAFVCVLLSLRIISGFYREDFIAEWERVKFRKVRAPEKEGN